VRFRRPHWRLRGKASIGDANAGGGDPDPGLRALRRERFPQRSGKCVTPMAGENIIQGPLGDTDGVSAMQQRKEVWHRSIERQAQDATREIEEIRRRDDLVLSLSAVSAVSRAAISVMGPAARRLTWAEPASMRSSVTMDDFLLCPGELNRGTETGSGIRNQRSRA
jgi:hypothetical protein